MRVKLAEIGSELPLRYAVPFVATIYAIGLYGFYQVCPVGSECGAGEEPFTFLNNALRTFGLFFSLAEPNHEALRNVWLMIARWIAPCITLFAIFRLFADRFKVWHRQFLLSRISNHQVLIGLGDSARHLMTTNHPIVFIDRLPKVFSGASFVPPKFSITGDGRELSVLTKARVDRAQSMLIMGGSDSENLDIISRVSKLRSKASAKLRIAVRLKSTQLATQLNKEDSFVGAGNLDVTAFTLDELAARVFLKEHPLLEMVDLRDLARVHLVIVGWSDFAQATLMQFLRISPFKNLDVPRISFVFETASLVLRQLHDQFPALADPEIVLTQAFDLANLHSDRQLAEIEKLDPVSAILVAANTDETNVGTGLALRQLTRISNRWLAPIYVKLNSSTAIENMLNGKFGLKIDPAQEVIAVGQTAKSLSFENVFGLRDDLAKKFHEAYVQKQIQRSAATRDWNDLAATYRNANIAATDHAAARILSAGYVISPQAAVPHGNWQIADGSLEMETISSLTHQAWAIDRRLDGWRYGKTRDNERLFHPSLKPYNQLSETVKELDRDQVRLLARVLQDGDGPVTCFKDCIVAALGHNALGKGEAEKIKAATVTALDHIHADYVALASPLAPGADSVIVAAAIDALHAQKRPFRLLILQALPWSVVRDEHAGTHGVDASLLDQVRDEILAKAGTSGTIVHLGPAGLTNEYWQTKPAARLAAYRTANQWMVDRAQHVLCHLNDDHKSLPGGTAEAFMLFKKTGSHIYRV